MSDTQEMIYCPCTNWEKRICVDKEQNGQGFLTTETKVNLLQGHLHIRKRDQFSRARLLRKCWFRSNRQFRFEVRDHSIKETDALIQRNTILTHFLWKFCQRPIQRNKAFTWPDVCTNKCAEVHKAQCEVRKAQSTHILHLSWLDIDRYLSHKNGADNKKVPLQLYKNILIAMIHLWKLLSKRGKDVSLHNSKWFCMWHVCGTFQLQSWRMDHGQVLNVLSIVVSLATLVSRNCLGQRSFRDKGPFDQAVYSLVLRK